MCMRVLPVCISVYHVCAQSPWRPEECQTPWDWSYMQMLVRCLWVLEITPASSSRAASVLSQRAISPPTPGFLNDSVRINFMYVYEW